MHAWYIPYAIVWSMCFGSAYTIEIDIVEYTKETHTTRHPIIEEPRSRINESRVIQIDGDNFTLNGENLQIVSGSIHYFRVPSHYWKDSLYKAKAAGLNAISTYVEWSFHQPEEQEYNFRDDHDIARFMEIAAKLGLYVLLRPGPYICAERDLGGLPYWLLGKYPNIKLRTVDKDFIVETKLWMNRLFKELSPYLYGNGGPIILVQVENEYGSYGEDMEYKILIRDIIKEHVGENAVLYTTDGAGESYLRKGRVEGALTTLDCGVCDDADLAHNFAMLRKLIRNGPLMNSEYYTGWLTHWGEKFPQYDGKGLVKGLDFMIRNNISVNMYMFHGGTNFEFYSGANTNFLPTITSYDYDAPLTEAGDLTPKYHLIRELMIKYKPEIKNMSLPEPRKKGNYGQVHLSKYINLLSVTGRKVLGKYYGTVNGSKLPTFESLRQRAGLILYETILTDKNGTLEIKKPRDRIYVYVNLDFQGIIDRETEKFTLKLTNTSKSVLSLMVENQGRINFGYHKLDFKGILSKVYYNGVELSGKWVITGYPLNNIPLLSSKITEKFPSSTMLFTANFRLPDKPPLDTYLFTPKWKKGYAWINGHCLGRYWSPRGPQLTLFVPGVWLSRGENVLHILELEKPPKDPTATFIDFPIFYPNVAKTKNCFANNHLPSILRNKPPEKKNKEVPSFLLANAHDLFY